MNNPATFRRTAAAAGLLASVVLMLVSVALAPDFPGEHEALLAEIEAAGVAGRISAISFALSQLALIAGLLGIGHLLRAGAPRLSNLGTSLGLVGAFGHSVYSGIAMVQLSMATDTVNRSVHAEILREVESGPAVAFMAMGLLGTVLGILVLSIGLWRAHVGPRWVAPMLGAFLVVEFAGTAVTDWASQVAVLLFGIALVTLAAAIWRTPERLWQTGLDTSAGDAAVRVGA